MDSLTQITLGAAVGEATLGRKVGNKAVLWGAAAGLAPDLDVLTAPFVSDMTQLALHRGISHSFFFAIVAAPLFGWLLAKLHRKGAASWRDWSLLIFLCFFTHALLDVCTVYGTQIFQPFSNYPAALNSVFIIDPLYSLPLLLGVVVAALLPRETRRRLWNAIGLGLSTFYLAWGLGVKQYVEQRFASSLAQQGIEHRRLFSAPAPLNSVLWNGMAETEDSLYVGMYSLLDPLPEDGVPQIAWLEIPKHRDRIAASLAAGDTATERLLWFSRGYFTITENENGRPVFNDLRFGRGDGWLTDHGAYIFRFVLEPHPSEPGRFVGFEQRRPDFDGRSRSFDRLWRRIQGDRSARALWKERYGEPGAAADVQQETP